MTITSNLHIGLAVWSNHTFTLGERCGTGGNAYQCITAGTSTSAPTGTSADVDNGGAAHFKWLSAIDYTSWQASYDAIASPLTQPVERLIWNDGVIQCVIGTILFFPGGKAGTSATNTITYKPAPGESFRDQASSTPINVDPTKGVTIKGATSGTASPVSYLWIVDPWFVVEGIQFLDTYATSQANFFLVASANNVRIRGCLFDSYTQTAGGNFGAIVTSGTTDSLVVANCFGIDRATSNVGRIILQGNGSATADKVVNSTFISSSTSGVAVEGSGSAANALVVKNCAMLGQTNPVTGASGTAVGVDHCVMSGSGLSFATDNGSNLFSKTAANQFVSATVDFRLKAGADCIHVAVNDTTDVPLSDDLFKSLRPSGLWDVGCYQLTAAVASAITEAATAADARSAAMVAAPAVTEAAVAAAVPTVTMVAAPAITEAGSATDVPVVVTPALGVITEAASAADTSTAAMVAAVAVPEAASAADSLFGALPFHPGITEAATSADVLSAAMVAALVATEAASAADIVAGSIVSSTTPTRASMFFGS